MGAESKKAAAYGSWKSPVSAAMLASKSLGLAEPATFGGAYYWLETRPSEQGRSLIVEYCDGRERELCPAEHSVRSGVHEYGGGAWTICEGGLFYVNSKDQAIYRSTAEPGCEPMAFFQRQNCRYADLHWNTVLGQLLAVEEEHSGEAEPVNRLVTLKPGQGVAHRQVLAEGADFYASGRISPCGKHICWLQWNHPSMPWYGCELWLGSIGNRGIQNPLRIAGSANESIFQPDWIDQSLYFCSDRNQQWQLFRYRQGSIEQVSHFDGECGLPLWQFGMKTWCLHGDKLLCAVSRQARWSLYQLNPENGQQRPLELQASLISGIASDGAQSFILASSETQPAGLILLGPQGEQLVRSSMALPLQKDDMSRPQAIQVGSGEAGCHAFYYPPCNQAYMGLPDELPPLVVMCHGGPTAATAPALNLKVQFWTSRGFAVADVNYRGSTGYGREYREALDGQWGIADVEDACNTALALAAEGRADRERLLIRGSSAGGLTVLSALTFHSVFAAGASVYGIGDLKILAAETHKFESRYGDRLIAPWPERADVYEQRSPLTHIEKLNSPAIFFQGLLDRVVPPNQASMMYQALRGKGVPTALRTYENEGHGFRSEQAIVDSLNAELAFYGAVLGFTTDSTLQNLEIDNL